MATNLTDMLAKFVTANTASTSGSGTLPGNTVTNPREDLKGITTRSGVAYQGPPIPTSSVVKPINTEVTKDQVQFLVQQSTAHRSNLRKPSLNSDPPLPPHTSRNKSQLISQKFEMSLRVFNPEFCTTRILMEEGLCTSGPSSKKIPGLARDTLDEPKKGGMSVVVKRENVLVPNRLLSGMAGAENCLAADSSVLDWKPAMWHGNDEALRFRSRLPHMDHRGNHGENLSQKDLCSRFLRGQHL
ncbi:hypothetical protein Tco_0856894 [Tanacetum coccineum]|uniref:Reverse transcriptase domain-containing protein n=1 Tax=Tanacetum coccineum TaxID=301880 RepID=A0ABQ5B837_9ASTR